MQKRYIAPIYYRTTELSTHRVRYNKNRIINFQNQIGNPLGEATTLRCGVVSQKRRRTEDCTLRQRDGNFHAAS